MNREILFRGKRLDNDDWECGQYAYCGYTDNMKHYIIPNYASVLYASVLYAREVDPDTVGQYTGVKDKNGVMIFEGDILEAHLDSSFPEDVTHEEVKWLSFGWHLLSFGADIADELEESDGPMWTVCGNIWDNPELMC